MDRSIQNDGPRVLVTLGDPRGVGPELVARALAKGILTEETEIFGPRSIIEKALEPFQAEFDGKGLRIHDTASDPFVGPGAVQVEALEAAVAQAMLDPDRSLLVTGPITKYDAQEAGFSFVGQTEFLAARAGVSRPVMLMAGPRLRVCLATTHMALSQVSGALSRDGLVETIRITAEAMVRDFGMERPRIGVCGLNPHAGEQGRFGREEMEVIAPAIHAARDLLGQMGLDVELGGPLPADTLFWLAVEGHWDLVLAMYHDQGLVASKLLDFHRTVNVTLGLPFVRTSPDHGPARNLAGTGTADSGSFDEAVRLGLDMWRHRMARG